MVPSFGFRLEKCYSPNSRKSPTTSFVYDLSCLIHYPRWQHQQSIPKRKSTIVVQVVARLRKNGDRRNSDHPSLERGRSLKINNKLDVNREKMEIQREQNPILHRKRRTA